jgi:predicted extracellular nuclease
MKQLNIIKSVILIALIAGNSFNTKAQNKFYNSNDNFTIAFYNVENLFDTINNPDKIDEQFLPNSNKKWNTGRYKKKINDLARVISSININELPEIVGLCEVENKAVLTDLVNSRFLSKGEYGIIHEESPDARGIDVALLYRKSEFKYLSHQVYQIYFDFEPETTTRNILHVAGKLNNGETLHIFVNHWSSRRDGQKKSEPKRLQTAKILRTKVDSIFKQNKKAKIVIIGDFNDEPTNKSIHEVLNATNNLRTENKTELYNLMFDKSINGQGTYNYRGNWNMLDNIIVSRNLINNKKGYAITPDGGQILKKRWMIYDNVKTGQFTPSKTYGGPNYYGGISDHFPVYVNLRK